MEQHRRILLIDDNEAIHNDFRKILVGESPARFAVDAAAATLFDRSVAAEESPRFEIDSAYQGEEGFQMALQACEKGQPYCIAFIDMRMPPGWDGVHTVKRIWQVDPEIQVVFCTAYSDYTGIDILQRFGINDRLLMLKKPFDRAEVLLLSTMLCNKWQLSRATAAITTGIMQQAMEAKF